MQPGSPSRPSGILASIPVRVVFAFSLSANIHSVSGERKTVGAIAFTVMPYLPHSQPSAFVRPSVAAFDAQYAL